MQIIKGIKFLRAYASSKSHINADLSLIMEMVNELDRSCDIKLKKKFKKNAYAKKFYQQGDLKEEVLKSRYKKGTFGSELKKFWKENKEDLFKKNLNISKTKHKKDVAYMKGTLNEHDLIHCLNKLDSTPLAEVSVLALSLIHI